MRCFRGLGVGKKSQEERIQQEVGIVIESIAKKEGRHFDMFSLLNSAAGM